MTAVGRAMIAGAYRKLKPWLESIEQQHLAQESHRLAPGLLPLTAFLIRLTDETTRAERYRRELGLVVFQVPAGSPRQQRELEIALRDCLRKADVPARLSEHVLAVILPETGAGAPAAAERIALRLSGIADSPVTGGFAHYPADGEKGSDLMRIATERSSVASGSHPTGRHAPPPE
jgi:hypothetical protein